MKGSLINGGRILPSSEGQVALGEHLLVSLNKHWRNYRKSIRLCQRRLTEKSVHHLRVEIRRLLALLELLTLFTSGKELKKIRHQLKRRLRALGALHDTQVQVGFVRKMLPTRPELRPFYGYLREHKKRLGKATAGTLQNIKLPKRLAALEETLQAVFINPAADGHSWQIANQSVSQAFTQMARLQQQANSNPATLHRTRIALKRLRYLLEMLEPVLAGVGQEQLKRLRDCQAAMGDINDLEVIEARTKKLVAKKKLKGEDLRSFIRALAGRRSRLVKSYLRLNNVPFDTRVIDPMRAKFVA